MDIDSPKQYWKKQAKSKKDKKTNKRRKHTKELIIAIGVVAIAFAGYILYTKLKEIEEEEISLSKIDTQKVKNKILKYLRDYRDSVFKHYLCTVIFLKFDIDVDRQKEIEEKYPDYRNQLVRKKVEDIIEEHVEMDVLKSIMKDIVKDKLRLNVEYEYPADYMHLLYEYEELMGKRKAHEEIEKILNEKDKEKNREEIEKLDKEIMALKEGARHET